MKLINIKYRLWVILFLCPFTHTYAQDSFSTILQSIENNNTMLRALQKQAESRKIENKTGIRLPNPEVEFNYLWGNPTSMGNRTDLNVTQSFDFPTAYRYKSQLAEGRNKQVDMEYLIQRKEILQQARVLCIELAYGNILNKELSKRSEHATELFNAYQSKFEKGDVDVLERNKARLNMLDIHKTLEMNRIENKNIEAELVRLNGSTPLPAVLSGYRDYVIPADFDRWYETIEKNNPNLSNIEQSIELNRKQEQLTRAMNLPKLSAGYMSERIAGTTLQGVTIGVSIPLWENKNTVKYVKAQRSALQSIQEDNKLQFRGMLQNQYNKALELQKLITNYREAIYSTSDGDLLKKALEKGQLSLINYLMELSVYYNVTDKLLEAERDYQLSVAELQTWEATN